jgi:hypothetical protein
MEVHVLDVNSAVDVSMLRTADEGKRRLRATRLLRKEGVVWDNDVRYHFIAGEKRVPDTLLPHPSPLVADKWSVEKYS